MNTFLIFVVAVLVFQVVWFFLIRKKKKEERKNSVKKYNISSSSDAFRLIQDTSIPEEDRKILNVR